MNSQSQGFLVKFLNMPVTVSTPLGDVTGVLLRADISEHGGIGNLLLQTREGWMLVKEWICMKRRM